MKRAALIFLAAAVASCGDRRNENIIPGDLDGFWGLSGLQCHDSVGVEINKLNFTELGYYLHIDNDNFQEIRPSGSTGKFTTICPEPRTFHTKGMEMQIDGKELNPSCPPRKVTVLHVGSNSMDWREDMSDGSACVSSFKRVSEKDATEVKAQLDPRAIAPVVEEVRGTHSGISGRAL